MPDVVTASPVGPRADFRKEFATARLIAIVAGLLGTLLALATPFLPVTQTTAQVNWPQGGQVTSVDAPLVSEVPVDLSASIPCSTVEQVPARGGILLSTAPARGKGAALSAMFVRVSESSAATSWSPRRRVRTWVAARPSPSPPTTPARRPSSSDSTIPRASLSGAS